MNIQFSILQNHLKKHLACLYLIIGKEIILVDRAADLIKQTAIHNKPNEPIENTKVWLENNQDWETLYINMQYNPMFCSQEIIHAKYQKNAFDQETHSYLQKIINIYSENRLVILEAPNLNAKIFEKLFAHLPHAHLVHIAQFNQKTLIDYIKTLLTEACINYHNNVPRLIADFSQGNAIAAKQCINQCQLLFDSTKTLLDENFVLNILHDTAIFPLYTFVDTCIKGNLPLVLRQLKALQQNQTEPTLLLWWLNKITKQLLIIKYKLTNAENLSIICKELKIWQTQETLYKEACKRLCLESLKKIILYLGKIDMKIKSNFDTDVWDAFERVAITLCKPQAHIFLS